MQVIIDPMAMARWSAEQRALGHRIGFVPTMGALHNGHLALVRQAREACDVVVVSIFVNPLQFTDPEDLRRYPRRQKEDAELLTQEGCAVLFTPTEHGIYAGHSPRKYPLGGLDEVLEGVSRPGHFQGMVNVVERLFHYVRPDEAFFGEKDRQQLTIVQHMAASFRWPERITPGPTVREDDGLAMSSRNVRLTPEHRAIAPLLYAGLVRVQELAFKQPWSGCKRSALELLAQEPAIQVDYLRIVHPSTLADLSDEERPETVLVLVAATLGAVRLIDNIAVHR